MALDITPEQRAAGQANFNRTADGLTRRGFMKSLAASGAAVAVATPAAYFGYKSIDGKPVKAVLIGGGDEGGVLVGEHNPAYLEFIAVCDIRPSNMKRIFEGDPKTPLRKGFKKVYGERTAEKIKKIDSYDAFTDELRNNKDIEAVVIALPLCMHAKAAIDAMKIGKERGKPIHVLTEKLMAWNIKQCKQMIRTAKDCNSILSVGHQRHYSLLYAHATEVVNAGVLGDIRHIRALWHRNFAWPFDPKTVKDKIVEDVPQPFYRDGWFPPITHKDYDALADKQDVLKKYGFDDIEHLIRWRLYQATGGGLMAELGSHQLDACSIFLGHVHPLAVSGVGVRSFFGPGHNDRDIDDHVFATYEFPGKNYAKDKNDVVVVTYSSISTNGFENYGECVMGDRGTLIVEKEESVMLYPENEPGKAKTQPRGTEVGVSAKGKGEPVLESGSTWGGPTAAVTGTSVGTGHAVSRGYREEMEDFAYCVRQWDPRLGYAKDSDDKYKQRLTRCHGEVAMVDAIVALTANHAMHTHQRIEFKDAWFDAGKPDVPPSDQKAKVEIA
ncbi:MAG TPA: Gfo/Idh/MocA family oxidoreductase [Gemmataceae bacterium]|nr:Gfo/Idh/MocA family oxidoreductase [Gemmataceae bacterium]